MRTTPRRHRSTAALVVATALATTVAGCSATGGGSDSKTLVVSSFPFGSEELTKAVIEPFEKKTGYKVELDTGNNATRLTRLEAAGGRSDVDVMLISDYYAALGQSKGLFQKFGAKDVPNMSKLSSFAVDEAYDGPAYTYQLNGTLYRTDKLDAKAAADWAVYGDKKYAKKTALPDISVTSGQLTVSGVGETYGSGPYDIDAAYAKLGSWAPHTLQFYSSSTEVTNLLTQGEIVAAPAISAFATSLIQSGEPVSWVAPSKGKYMATNRMMIPKDAKNLKAAYAFIDYYLSAEAQTQAAKVIGDMPVNPDATIPSVLGKVAGKAATDPVGAGFRTLDPGTVVKNRDTWVERFAREVSSK
ncbi:ABC transporter substrate-binding protein [Streptomyces sp. KM273126]|uniref:ABC transporter substrate-binding protein n=1 Tax=Streptomyces sp. KM273126 TaxID=2545247 RepID=UPI00103F1686|nr:ABC transporter substrate-binding protein [Streptomyces sp. KM273126]MBA2810368.1 ABC transporter substrate-binding protein [Streptomyces sp. KM273126]